MRHRSLVTCQDVHPRHHTSVGSVTWLGSAIAWTICNGDQYVLFIRSARSSIHIFSHLYTILGSVVCWTTMHVGVMALKTSETYKLIQTKGEKTLRRLNAPSNGASTSHSPSFAVDVHSHLTPLQYQQYQQVLLLLLSKSARTAWSVTQDSTTERMPVNSHPIFIQLQLGPGCR